MSDVQSAIRRALELSRVLDIEHNHAELSLNFRAVRHELKTLEGLLCPPQLMPEPELASAHTGRATRPGSLRHKILAVLSFGPLADFQTRDLLAKDRPHAPDWPRLGQVRRRRHELMAARWVEPCPNEEGDVVTATHAATGRECATYRLTTAGLVALARLRSGQEVLFTDSELGNGPVT